MMIMRGNLLWSSGQDADKSKSREDESRVGTEMEAGGKGIYELTEELVREYKKIVSGEREKGALIEVDEIATKVASFYEKVRGIIDWKEEHLIRRTATERVLKRRLLGGAASLGIVMDAKTEKVAEPLVTELIRGGHYPNNKIPKSRLASVQKALEKYAYILKHSPLSKNGSKAGLKRKVNFYNWLLEIAACEIEEILDPPRKQNLMMEFMSKMISKRIVLNPEKMISEDDRMVQIYIAVHKTLYHLDAPIISYHLLKHRYPEWFAQSEEEIVRLGGEVGQIWEGLEKDLGHPLGNYFYGICEKYDTLYLILGDILASLEDNPEEMAKKIFDPAELEKETDKFYRLRYSTLKKRLFRMAIYSTLSVLVAGAVSLFIVEVPLAKLLYGNFNGLAIFVDIMLPTAVTFILVAMVRMPKEGNLIKVKEEMQKIVFKQKVEDTYEVKVRGKRNIFIQVFVTILYILGTGGSLWGTYKLFDWAGIPITSLYIDTLNVAVLVFAAIIIRGRAKELVVEDKPTFWEFLIDTLSIPIGKIGQWLSSKWKEYNIASVFFTILVDIPFVTVLEFVEGWSTFIKEKKAEIR
jgi:hypothetical protein